MRFAVSPSAVTRIIQRFEASGSLKSSPRSGRPKSLSDRDIRVIVRKVRQNHRLTQNELIEELGLPVSPSTIFRALKDENLRKWKAKKRISLSENSAEERLSWALEWEDRIDELMQVRCVEDKAFICG